MSEALSKVASPPGTVDAPPATVEDRLQTRLLVVRSVWFPTQRELRAWRDSGVPLYVRRLGPARVEVGPRLESMWAACFAPVLEARIAEDGASTHLEWRRRWPRFTLGLLIAWWVVLIGWLLAQGDPGRLPFWAFMAVMSTLGPAVGWVFGGRALDQSVPWLTEALCQPEVDEDW